MTLPLLFLYSTVFLTLRRPPPGWPLYSPVRREGGSQSPRTWAALTGGNTHNVNRGNTIPYLTSIRHFIHNNEPLIIKLDFNQKQSSSLLYSSIIPADLICHRNGAFTLCLVRYSTTLHWHAAKCDKTKINCAIHITVGYSMLHLPDQQHWAPDAAVSIPLRLTAQAPVPITIFWSNSKFDKNLERSSLRYV